MDIKELSERLAIDVENVASYLLPRGKRVGNEWCVGSIDGGAGKSLKIHLSGAKAGIWSDFATGDSGDLVDLWKSVKNLTTVDVIKEIKSYLGIKDNSFYHYSKKRYVKPVKFSCSKPQGKVLTYLTQIRKLTKESLEAYKIRANKDDTEIIFPYLRESELINVKRLKLGRSNGKKIISTSINAEPCLFGWQAIDDDCSKIVICEGELDAATSFQYGYPALSVPYGAENHQWIDNDYSRLERFSDIYICFDSDKAGKDGLSELVTRLGRHRCLIVKLPYKDINECLQKGVSKSDIDKVFMAAKPDDPAELKEAITFYEDVVNKFNNTDEAREGACLPFVKVKNRIRLARGELSIWTGLSGSGKSQILGQTVLSLMEQDEKICMASLEMKPVSLLYRLIRQITTLRDPSTEEISDSFGWLYQKLWIFDLVGTAKSSRIFDVFLYARRRYGIRHFVIDSLMKCGIAEDDYRGQKDFIDKLCDFKTLHDCHIHLVAHSRKKESSDKVVDKMDVKGTGAITDLADNVFSLWRNKKKERDIEQGKDDYTIKEKPDAILYCDKQRNGEWEGGIPLWWDGDSFQFMEDRGDLPKKYLANIGRKDING